MPLDKQGLEQIEKIVGKSERRIIGVTDKAIQESEQRIVGITNKSIEKSELKTNKAIQDSERRVVDIIDKSIEKSEQRIISVINREITDLAEINRAVIDRVDKITELEKRVLRLERVR